MTQNNNRICKNVSYEQAAKVDNQTKGLYNDSILAHYVCSCSKCARSGILKPRMIGDEATGTLFDSLDQITKYLYSRPGGTVVTREVDHLVLMVDLASDILSILVLDTRNKSPISTETVAVKRFIRKGLMELECIAPFLSSPKPKSTREIIHESRIFQYPPVTGVEEIRESKLDVDDLISDDDAPSRLWNLLNQLSDPVQFSLQVEDRDVVFRRIDSVIISTSYPVTDKICLQAFNVDGEGQKEFTDYCNSLIEQAIPASSPVCFDTEQAVRAMERGCHITCVIKGQHGSHQGIAYTQEGKVFVAIDGIHEVASIDDAVGCLADFCNSGFLLSVKQGTSLD